MNKEFNFPESVLTALDSFFADGRCPHAILIDGSGESEREALARLTARMIVCENKDRTPCGICEHCRKATEYVHPDIIAFKKPDDKKKFVKDDVKKLVADAHLTPNEADKKVYIISELQNMSVECQNLLLKILEEPPVYTAFVLTAQSANTVIGTVLSRVVRLRLGTVQGTDYSDKAIEVVRNLSAAACTHREYDKIKATAPLDGNKKLTVEVLTLFISVLRDAIAMKNGGRLLSDDFKGEAENLSKLNTLKKLLDMYDTVCDLYKLIDNNPNYTLLSAVLCARL